MDGIGAVVNGALDGLNTELLVVAPAAVGVAALIWGAPKALRFFKSLSK